MKSLNPLTGQPQKVFFSYLIPAVSASLVTSIYILADTILIGKGIGHTAVAALNIVLPLFNLLFATSSLFGIGGSVLMSTAFGRQDKKQGELYFTASCLLNITFIIFYFLTAFVYFEKIAYFMGATEQTISYVLDYGYYITLGIPFFMLSNQLQTFIRNDKSPRLAMTAVIAGGLTNILLDYIFVFPLHMEMKGAALASILGVILTCIILLYHFSSPTNNLRFNFSGLKPALACQIIKNGLSSFFIEISSGLVIFVFNLQLLKYIGEIGITIYGIVSNTTFVVSSLSNGIAQATQPIISLNFGAGKKDRIASVKRLGIISALTVGSLISFFGLAFPLTIIKLFINPTQEILGLAPLAIQIYFCSFLGMALNIFYTDYFQAVLKPHFALTVCLLRGLVCSISFVYLLPIFLGVNGIWLTMPLSEILTLITAISLSRAIKN